MMKKTICILFFAFFSVVAASATDYPVERVFVSTDREAYIAGDVVWCSLFCVDGEGHLSSTNAVAYLELVSTDGSAAQAKIGLLGGRGSGVFRIPVSVPTGVYRLLAYTSSNTNEQGTPWLAGSRILTIFNTLSTERVKDGVQIIGEQEYGSLSREAAEECGSLVFNSSARVQKGSSHAVLIQNNGPEADFSLSVYHEDGIVPVRQENSISSFLGSLAGSPDPVFVGDRPVEYDGEIISAQVNGKIKEDSEYSYTTLSSAGSPSNLYIGVNHGKNVRFMTNNIYGDREIVCEVSNLDQESGSITIEDPFIYPSAGSIPKLPISKILYQDLSARKVALRSTAALKVDTLSTFLRYRQDLLLESLPIRRYHLDDYTRFPTVREVLVEIIPMLSLHREGKGKYSLRLMVTDGTDSFRSQVGNLLVMMDGVVISDLNILLAFDAMLLEDVDLYQQAFICGKIAFSGIVNFVTKKNYVTAIPFPANVQVVDFKGVSYPVAYYGTAPSGDGEDSRQLLYWDPAAKIEAGGQKRINLTAPDYPGRFRAVAEGVAADGTPIHHEWTFEVE